MANELQLAYDTGSTITAKVYNTATASLASTVSVPETGTGSAYFAANFPALAAGTYAVVYFSGSTRIGTEVPDIVWSGTAVVVPSPVFTFSGARPVTLAISITAGGAAASAVVRVTQGANSQAVQSDVGGNAAFSLDDGTYTVSISKSGYSFSPATISVDSSHTTFSFALTAISQPTAADPSQARCYLKCYDTQGNPQEGVQVMIACTGTPIPPYSNGARPSNILVSTSDADGDLLDPTDAGKGIVLAQHVYYFAKRGTEATTTDCTDWTKFMPSSDPFTIPAIIGKDSPSCS